MSEGDRFHGCSPSATIVYECALLPSSASTKDDNDRSLNAPLISFFFFFFVISQRRPCMPLTVQKNIIFLRRGAGLPPSGLPPTSLPPSVPRSSRPQSNLAQTEEGKSRRSSRLDGAARTQPPALVLQAGIHTVN